MMLLRNIWKTYVTDLRDSVDAECAEYRGRESAALVTRRLAIVFFGAATCMMLVRFCGNVGDPKWLGKLLEPIGLESVSDKFELAMTTSPDKRLNQRIWWAVVRVVAYLILPLVIIKVGLRARLRDMGLSIRGASQWKVYALMLAVVMPVVVVASYETSFQNKYPYYRLQPGEPLFPGLVAWELLYALNFLGIELFFRGFFIHGLRREIGYAAVFAPLVPYVTIHWGKPFPEAFGSMLTAFILGTMSLKTRSVWGGTFLHAVVACSMDLLSLWHRGLL